MFVAAAERHLCPGDRYAPALALVPALTPTAPRLPAGGIPGDATFLIGPDIQPGTYRTSGQTAGPLPNCYWAKPR